MSSAKLHDPLAFSMRSTTASIGGRTIGGAESSDAGASGVSNAGASVQSGSAHSESQRTLGVAELTATAEALQQTRRDFWDPTLGIGSHLSRCSESLTQDTLRAFQDSLFNESRPMAQSPVTTWDQLRRSPVDSGSAGAPVRSEPQSAREVVWAGARVERQSGATLDLDVATHFQATVCEEKQHPDARSRRFSSRSPPPAKPRCPSAEKLAHSRSPSFQVEEEWRESLCKEKRCEPELALSRSPPARSTSRRARRGTTCESSCHESLAESSRLRARSLSVAMFGPESTWPARSQSLDLGPLRAMEHTDALGQQHYFLAQRSASRSPEASDRAARRKHVQQISDSQGHCHVCMSGRTRSVSQRQPPLARPLFGSPDSRQA